MALRHRDIVSAITDHENLSKASKTHLLKQPSLESRPALNDLANKVNATKNPLKRQESLKELKKTKDNVSKKEAETVAYSSQRLEDEAIIDPDADTADEPQMVTEYLGDIYGYLRDLEVKFPIKKNFLEGHRSSPRMRAILVNWLVQVHQNFKLCLETLYLCVSIVDRYIQINKDVGRDILQLVGTSAMMVACKYEEMYVPSLADFIYICEDAFTGKQILKMEIDILKQLEYNLGRPLPIHFLRRYSKIGQVHIEHHNLAKYILETALLDHSVAHVRPSIQAAAACCLSLSIVNELSCPSKAWTRTLVRYTTYSYNDFKPVVHKFASMLLGAENSKHQMIRSKYSAANFGKISTNPKLRGSLVRKLAQLADKS